MQRRLLFVSRYRGFLMVLVVLASAGAACGAPAGLEECLTAISWTLAPGAFFFLSAYFLPGSLASRGARDFLRARALRLIAPLVVFSVAANLLPGKTGAGMGAIAGTGILVLDRLAPGPLGFLPVLLLFTLAATACVPLLPRGLRVGLPSRRGLALFILCAALSGYLMQGISPGSRLDLLPLFILLFAAGMRAGREQWLEDIASLAIGPWSWLACLGLLLLPALAPLHPRAFSWQSAVEAAWQAGTGVSLLVVTLVLFARARWVAPGPGESFGSSSYGIYLLHPFVVVPLAQVLGGLPLPSGVAWAIVSACGVGLPWAAARGLRKLPGLSRVF